MRRCPDEGACHHECGDGPCWRVANCGPLSAAKYPRDEWPVEVRREHGAVTRRAAADRRRAARREDEREHHYAVASLLNVAVGLAEALEADAPLTIAAEQDALRAAVGRYLEAAAKVTAESP